MQKVATIILILLLSSQLKSQSIEWIRGKGINYSSNPDLLNYNLATSPDGSVWYAGLNSLSEMWMEAMGDMFLIQYNEEGDLLQEFIVTGSLLLSGMETDANGYIYIAGRTQSDVSFWEGSNIEYIEGSDGNGFLARMSPAGVVDWAINLALLYPFSVPQAMHVSDNSIFLVHNGNTGSTISVFDTEGNVLQDIFQQDVFMASGMDTDEAGNIYVTGSCPAPLISLGGVEYSTPFLYSIYLFKYSPEGVPQWVKFVEDITCAKPRVAIRNDGIVLWTGVLEENGQGGGNPADKGWVSGIGLTALDSNGEVLWIYDMSYSPNVRLAKNISIQVMPDNSLSIAGSSRGIINWGNGVVSGREGFDTEVLILNINSDGLANWAVTGGGPGHDAANAIAMDTAGSLYVAAVGSDTIQFDGHTFTSDPHYFPFLFQLKLDVSTSYPEQVKKSELFCYPNPAYGTLFVETSSGIDGSLTIISLDGQELWTQHITGPNTKLDVSGLSLGVYVLKMVSNSLVATTKFIVR